MTRQTVIAAVTLLTLAHVAVGQGQVKKDLRDKMIPQTPGTPDKDRGSARIKPNPESAPDEHHFRVRNRWKDQVSYYRALVRNAGAIEKVSEKPVPVPDIVINTGWLYVNGSKPCVGTNAVVAQAEGSAVSIQCYTVNSTRYHRVYYLEGDPDKLVWVFPTSTSTLPAVLTVGTYVDAEVSTTNAFVKWKQAPPADQTKPQRPIPDVLDENEPWYAILRNEIELLSD